MFVYTYKHNGALPESEIRTFLDRFREVMEATLEVLVRDRSFDEGKGRSTLLKLFEALGGSDQYDDLIREFRRKLSAALN